MIRITVSAKKTDNGWKGIVACYENKRRLWSQQTESESLSKKDALLDAIAEKEYLERLNNVGA